MHTMSIDTAQQLVADRRASYEGVATRRRLRKLARTATHVAPKPSAGAFPPAEVAGSGDEATKVETGNVETKTASRKVA